MKLDRRADVATLSALGVEAVRLLCSEDINSLAMRFGYALAFDREPELAIREDLRSCLAEFGAASIVSAPKHTPTVKYLEPNDSGLFAVVECEARTDNGAKVLVELIVTKEQGEEHVTLEQISVAA
jgi:hypothetical protein